MERCVFIFSKPYFRRTRVCTFGCPNVGEKEGRNIVSLMTRRIRVSNTKLKLWVEEVFRLLGVGKEHICIIMYIYKKRVEKGNQTFQFGLPKVYGSRVKF